MLIETLRDFKKNLFHQHGIPFNWDNYRHSYSIPPVIKNWSYYIFVKVNNVIHLDPDGIILLCSFKNNIEVVYINVTNLNNIIVGDCYIFKLYIKNEKIDNIYAKSIYNVTLRKSLQ